MNAAGPHGDPFTLRLRTAPNVMPARKAAIQEPVLNCWRQSPWMAGLNPAMT